jgi:hypothetical protein
MSKISPILLGMSLALAGGTIAAAQDAAPALPKVLQITREFLKPGKSGTAHDKSEAAFVAAMNRNKIQGHYIALNSMSGKSRALYITRYPSFEAWEADNKTVEKNTALTAELDRDMVADGELLDGLDQAVFTYNEELSYHPHSDLSHARYFELTMFHVRAGHGKEWRQTVKMYQDACDKANNGAHWAAYDMVFGAEGGAVMVLSARDSMKQIDEMMAGGKKFVEAMGGEDGMQKFDELSGQAIDSMRTELFAINPRQSYAEEAWIKDDPDFWKPKKSAPETATAKPAATKPAPAAAKPGGR